MGRPNGQRTGPNGASLWSASQLKQRLELGGCDVRWGHNRLLKLEEPQGKNAGRGTDAHSECENWYLFGRLPTTPHACAAVLTVRAQPRYKSTKQGWIESPHFVELEVPVRFDHGGQSFIGYIDMAYDWSFEPVDGYSPWDKQCDPDAAPLGSTGTTVIHDHKFSSSTNYAMTPAELEQDVAANIYAWEAFLGGAKRVLCRWVYTAFDAQKPKEVWCEMDPHAVHRRMDELAAIAADGSAKRQLFKEGKLHVLELEKNFSQCHAYRQDCPFMGTCNPHREVSKIQMRNIDMSSFEEQAESVAGAASKTLPSIPGAKKAPPPPPAKKTPPPPPVKLSPVDAAVAAASKGPLTENGTFNAPINKHTPEGVKTPSATPEAAAAAQGRYKIEETPEQVEETGTTEDGPAVSDLYELDTAQLKLLATSMGLAYPPRAKTSGMIKLITEARAKNVPADRPPAEIDEEATSEELDLESNETAEPLNVVEAISSDFNELFAKQLETVQTSIEKILVNPPAQDLKYDAELDGHYISKSGFDLYINAIPDGAYTTLSSIINRLSANFQEVTGKSDYRQVDYGKGPGLMAESIADDVQSWTEGSIVVDVRTHEGAAFVSTLEGLARRVIRGF